MFVRRHLSGAGEWMGSRARGYVRACRTLCTAGLSSISRLQQFLQFRAGGGAVLEHMFAITRWIEARRQILVLSLDLPPSCVPLFCFSERLLLEL
mgnify:CR=1 FL=1